MKKYEAVIFDMDGTLLYTLDDLTDAVNYALKELRMPERTLEEVRSFVGNGVRRLMELAVPEGEGNPRFEEAFELFKSYYSEHSCDKTCAYEGTLELISELRDEGYALAIVSNKLDVRVKELATEYFEGMIPVAIGELDGVSRKPAPDMVYRALSELGISAERAVYVGDSEVDLLTAKNAGLSCISVLWGFRDEEYLKACGATWFAKVPQEIKNYI